MGGLLHGFQRGVFAKQVQAEAAFQARGQRVQIGFERGDIVFAHGEEHPVVIHVIQGITQLAKELVFLFLVGGVAGEDFFKLVKDEYQFFGGAGLQALGEVVGDGCCGRSPP